MNVERRATRRSTAENRIIGLDSGESDKNGDTKVLSDLTVDLKKSILVKEVKENERKRSIVQDENKMTTDNNGSVINCVVEEKLNGDASIEKVTEIDDVVEDEDDGTPEPKMAKLDDEDLELDEETSNDNEVQQSKPKKKEKVTYPCPECDKKFLKKTFLTKHIKFHSAPRPFACAVEDCERTFIKNADMVKHQKIFHEGLDEALHLCQFCQKGFITRSEMDVHAETHIHEYKMYACRFCGKTFVKRFQMKIAVQACQNETPDPCPYCKKGINAKAYSDN